MSLKLYPETDIQNIADAIRELNLTNYTYTVNQFASVVETLGESNLPSIVDRTITRLYSSNITIVGSYALTYCINLSMVSLPKCSAISTYAFQSCYNLLSLYLMSTSRVALAGSNAFYSTPISTYTTSTGGIYGSIYVPSSLLASYKAATN